MDESLGETGFTEDQSLGELSQGRVPRRMAVVVPVLGQVCTGRVEQGCLALEQGCLEKLKGSLAPGSRQP